MRNLLALFAAAAVCPAVAAPARPLVPLYDAATVTRICEEGLARHRASIALMETDMPGGKNAPARGIFPQWNQLQIEIEDVINPVYLLGSVHPDKAVRDASEPCLQKYTTLSTELLQNEKLYARVKGAKPVGAHQAKLKRDLIEDFEENGVALPADKRARAKEIFDKIEELRQVFDRNIREDTTKVVMTAAEMEGLPEAYVKAQKRDADGNYVLGLAYPMYFPFMTNAKSEPARRRYYIAKMNEGGPANLEHLYAIFKLRQELAGLHGLPTFAHYALRRKMVRTPETVNKFLGEVKAALVDLEKKEIEELRAEKVKETGKPVGEVRLERWDLRYYQERVRRERFTIDQEGMRKYFPTDKAIDFALAVSQRLYAVKFTEVKVPTWHEDVRYFDVTDARTGKFISGFYLDLFPRDGKYTHAAAFPIRGVSLLAGRTPLAALVTNFNSVGLNHDELETLMHEFGHVLHGVLSRTDYNPHAGTSVKRDFVEAPSQMFEEWARREQPLALFKEVCPQCPQLTRDDIARLEAARLYGQGIRYSQQWLYATFDMALSTEPRPPLAVWKGLENATPLGHVEGTSFPSSFNHIASNYAAGYYGYMWSQVMALDMLSPFKKDMLDPKVGVRYRDTILAQGGQEEETYLVRKFLGRDPTSDAFFAEITGKR
jgi:Zn-dependent oligopeptidase